MARHEKMVLNLSINPNVQVTRSRSGETCQFCGRSDPPVAGHDASDMLARLCDWCVSNPVAFMLLLVRLKRPDWTLMEIAEWFMRATGRRISNEAVRQRLQRISTHYPALSGLLCPDVTAGRTGSKSQRYRNRFIRSRDPFQGPESQALAAKEDAGQDARAV